MARLPDDLVLNSLPANGDRHTPIYMGAHDTCLSRTDGDSGGREELVPDRLVRDGAIMLHHPFVMTAEKIIGTMAFLNRE